MFNFRVQGNLSFRNYFYDCSKPKYYSAVYKNSLESGCIKASTVEVTMYMAFLV